MILCPLSVENCGKALYAFLLLLTAKEKLFCTGLIKQEYESGGY
ncbi:hypothetical protein DR76_4940 (plasmid) [Escherichia coli ATCC 25922]|nr:hypothetical protein DR76_4940 [Escherichia coli ATCC 25922]UVX22804.1 hypothetical protein [Escherichia coli]UWM21140.1 hypothetical protein [Escherichia coli]UWM21441.1 hypothetical protein [Escherichia coli]